MNISLIIRETAKKLHITEHCFGCFRNRIILFELQWDNKNWNQCFRCLKYNKLQQEAKK